MFSFFSIEMVLLTLKPLSCEKTIFLTSKVSRESALRFNPDANIKAHHDNIMRYETSDVKSHC